jgi:hypothetical protein
MYKPKDARSGNALLLLLRIRQWIYGISAVDRLGRQKDLNWMAIAA